MAEIVSKQCPLGMRSCASNHMGQCHHDNPEIVTDFRKNKQYCKSYSIKV